jgi:hypothetical protein
MNRTNVDVELAKVSGRNRSIRDECKSKRLHEVGRCKARTGDPEKKELRVLRRKRDLVCRSCEWDTIAVT